MEKQYLSIRKVAAIYDVTPEFFYNRLDRTFKRGIHYIQHDKNTPIRLDVEAIERWWRGEEVENKAEEPSKHEDLIQKLIA